LADDGIIGTAQRAVRSVERRGRARSGKLRSMALPSGWLTVDQAEKLPEPNYFLVVGPMVVGAVHGLDAVILARNPRAPSGGIQLPVRLDLSNTASPSGGEI